MTLLSQGWCTANACLLACGLAFLGGSAAAQDKSRVLLFDGFDGKLTLNWQPVRPDPTHLSLETHKGMLTIRTQRGTIHRDEKVQGAELAKNLFVMENPLTLDTDFSITTSLHRFKPDMMFQQAGLLLYNDDDNYVKWVIQFNRVLGAGQSHSLLTEVDAVSAFRHYPLADDAVDVRLRLTKRGNSVSVASSVDGGAFEVLEQREWNVEGPTQIGLVAKNGGGIATAVEIDAVFDFFELKSPPE